MRVIILLLLFTPNSWAGIPQRFHGFYTGFETRAVARGASPSEAKIEIQINRSGITIVSAEDAADRRWRIHYPQAWIHPENGEADLRCFKISRVPWMDSDLQLCFKTLLTQGLPPLTVSYGYQLNSLMAELFAQTRITRSQPIRKLHKLYEEMKHRLSADQPPATRLNQEVLESAFRNGDLKMKSKVIRVSLRKIDLRKGLDQQAALTILRSALKSDRPELQELALTMMISRPRVSAFSEILNDFLTSEQPHPERILDAAVMAAIAVAGEAQAINEARAHFMATYGSESLDDVFALRLGVIQSESLPHLRAVLDYGSQTWSAKARVTLLTTLFRLSVDPEIAKEIAAKAGTAYVLDLARSTPYLSKLCRVALHGDADQRISGSETSIERAQ